MRLKIGKATRNKSYSRLHMSKIFSLSISPMTLLRHPVSGTDLRTYS